MTGAIVVGHKDFDKDSLLVGDIIAYDVYINDSKLLVVHRITDINDGIYSTKGDNNQYHDNWDVDFESIQYRIDGVFNQTSFIAKYGIMKTAILALIPMVGIGYLAMNIHSKLIMDKDELDLEDN